MEALAEENTLVNEPRNDAHRGGTQPVVRNEKPVGDGTSGQDRESYTDEQDRESYIVKEEL